VLGDDGGIEFDGDEEEKLLLLLLCLMSLVYGGVVLALAVKMVLFLRGSCSLWLRIV